MLKLHWKPPEALSVSQIRELRRAGIIEGTEGSMESASRIIRRAIKAMNPNQRMRASL